MTDTLVCSGSGRVQLCFVYVNLLMLILRLSRWCDWVSSVMPARCDRCKSIVLSASSRFGYLSANTDELIRSCTLFRLYHIWTAQEVPPFSSYSSKLCVSVKHMTGCGAQVEYCFMSWSSYRPPLFPNLFNRSGGGVEEQVNFNWNCAWILNKIPLPSYRLPRE